MKNLGMGMSTQQKPALRETLTSSPPADTVGAAVPRDSQSNRGLSAQRWPEPEAGTGTEKKGAVKPNELSDQTMPDAMGRHPDRRIHGSRQCSSKESDRQIWDKTYTY